MTPETFAKITAWLYVNHQAFPSASEWRKAFVEYLVSFVKPQEVYGEVDSENCKEWAEKHKKAATVLKYTQAYIDSFADWIDELDREKRTVQGKVRTGEEIINAIPNQKIFLHFLNGMKDPTFFEINDKGQLVMMDGCKEAYGLGEDFETAKKRQTHIHYSGNKLLMEKGLPTWEEYQRMNTGQFENDTFAWLMTGDSICEYAKWNCFCGTVYHSTNHPDHHMSNLGSRGVLRVNLDFKS